MALRFDLDKNADGLWAARYENERVGFGLAPHRHATRDTYHDVCAVAGRVIVFSDYWWRLLPIGEPWRGFDCAQPHGVTSDKPGAVWVNTYYNGGTAEFDAAREDERHTRLDARVDLPQWIAEQISQGKTSGTGHVPAGIE